MERIEKVWICTNNDLNDLLSKSERKKFNKWICGQTGVLIASGELAYFLHDVERFIKQIRFKVPTYFD
jgi:hypothetical protein